MSSQLTLSAAKTCDATRRTAAESTEKAHKQSDNFTPAPNHMLMFGNLNESSLGEPKTSPKTISILIQHLNNPIKVRENVNDY